MKSINTTEAKNKVRLLAAVIGYRRETEKIEKELKDWLKDVMGEDSKIQVGDFLVTKETRVRRDLDREAIESVLGDVSKYEKETVYEVLDLNTFQKKRGTL